jgi:hypothetical protein
MGSGKPMEPIVIDLESDRRRFRDEHDFTIAPLRDEARTNYDGALKFADAGLKALFGLNGGGLIALPAFVALFKADPRSAALWIIAAMIAFVLGLTANAAACLFGYWSAMKAVEALNGASQSANIKYALHYKQLAAQPDFALQAQKLDQKAEKDFSKSSLLRRTAVTFCLTSLVAFIIGACFAGWALTRGQLEGLGQL